MRSPFFFNESDVVLFFNAFASENAIAIAWLRFFTSRPFFEPECSRRVLYSFITLLNLDSCRDVKRDLLCGAILIESYYLLHSR